MSDMLYELELHITNVNAVGAALDALLSGQAPIPPQGARYDIDFAGKAKGQLNGALSGTDYLMVRSDGRVEIYVRGMLETDDGKRVAIIAEGNAMGRADSPISDIRERVQFHAQDESLDWLNQRMGWGEGTLNAATGTVNLNVYV